MVGLATRPPSGSPKSSLQAKIATVMLGRVDGFGDDEAESEGDE
jgi:hypothetical protein